jgi:hypothetical protein
VFNWYLFAGVILGYVAKLLFGGKAVSLVTGLVGGMFLFDIVKHLAFIL